MANSKFKVGDLVRVVDPAGNKGYRFGQEGTVAEVYGDTTYPGPLVRLKGMDGGMFERRFALVTPAVPSAPPKFNKGDRVKTIARLHGDAQSLPIGSEGTVTDGTGYAYPRVTFDNGETWCAYPSTIVRIPAVPPKSPTVAAPVHPDKTFIVIQRDNSTHKLYPAKAPKEHVTREAAEFEAARLAKSNLGCDFLVFEAIHNASAEVFTTTRSF